MGRPGESHVVPDRRRSFSLCWDDYSGTPLRRGLGLFTFSHLHEFSCIRQKEYPTTSSGKRSFQIQDGRHKQAVHPCLRWTVPPANGAGTATRDGSIRCTIQTFQPGSLTPQAGRGRCRRLGWSGAQKKVVRVPALAVVPPPPIKRDVAIEDGIQQWAGSRVPGWTTPQASGADTASGSDSTGKPGAPAYHSSTTSCSILWVGMAGLGVLGSSLGSHGSICVRTPLPSSFVCPVPPPSVPRDVPWWTHAAAAFTPISTEFSRGGRGCTGRAMEPVTSLRVRFELF